MVGNKQELVIKSQKVIGQLMEISSGPITNIEITEKGVLEINNQRIMVTTLPKGIIKSFKLH